MCAASKDMISQNDELNQEAAVMLLLALLLVMWDESSAAGGVHSVLLVPRRTGTGPTCRSMDIWVNMHELRPTSM